jgi:hypothetical protein
MSHLPRYPFVAAEILSNSAKLADAFIEEIKVEVPVSPSKEEPEQETKSVEDVLKEQQNSGAEKETLVDDLNAEIGETEDDDEDSNFAHLEREEGRARSRNVADKKKPEEEEAKTTTFSYEVMDALLGFFDQEKLEPILCGYFNKVMQNLVGKAKAKVLQYLLVQRKGDIFNLLLKNMQHHSLAILMVELLQIKITPSG